MSRTKIEAQESFIATLRGLNRRDGNYEAQVRAHCLGVLKRLSSAKYYRAGSNVPAYGLSIATKRTAVTRYRNAIREAFGDHHPALKYLKLKDADQDAIHSADRQRIATQHDARRPLDVDTHVDRARFVLENLGDCKPLEIAAALIAVTGRRPLEVLQDLTGHDFRPVDGSPDPTLFDVSIDDRWTILFGGQRKTRGAESARTAPYEIPVLVEPALVFAAIAHIRLEYPTTGMTATQIGDRAWKNLGYYCKGRFPSQISAGYRDRDGADLSPKDLRAAYACVAYERYAPRRLSWNAYTARILGHSELDLLTSFSYDVFYPYGNKGEYARETAAAARATLAALERKLAAEPIENVAVVAGIKATIASVRERLGESHG